MVCKFDIIKQSNSFSVLQEKLVVLKDKKINKKESCCVCICSRLDRLFFTKELVKSIVKQTRKPDLILFILSGYSYKILEERKKQLVRDLKKIKNIQKFNVSFVFSSKKGVAAARNIAADIVEQDILIFSDDDDIWLREKLDLTCKAIEKSKVPILVRHGFHTLVEKRLVKAKKIFFGAIDAKKGLIGNYYGGGSTLSANTSVFRNIRFNEFFTFCEDWEFWLRSERAGIPIFTINKSLVKYRFHNNRKTNSLFTNYKWELFLRSKIVLQGFYSIVFCSIGLFRASIVLLINYARLIVGIKRF